MLVWMNGITPWRREVNWQLAPAHPRRGDPAVKTAGLANGDYIFFGYHKYVSRNTFNIIHYIICHVVDRTQLLSWVFFELGCKVWVKLQRSPTGGPLRSSCLRGFCHGPWNVDHLSSGCTGWANISDCSLFEWGWVLSIKHWPWAIGCTSCIWDWNFVWIWNQPPLVPQLLLVIFSSLVNRPKFTSFGGCWVFVG